MKSGGKNRFLRGPQNWCRLCSLTYRTDKFPLFESAERESIERKKKNLLFLTTYGFFFFFISRTYQHRGK